MVNEKKVRYLKIDRGRYYYQRRVPDRFLELLGFSKWQLPCGNVTYAKAVQLIVNWAEEHDDLLKRLRTNDGYDEVEASIRRAEDEFSKRYMEQSGSTPVGEENGEMVPFDQIEKPWVLALDEIKQLDKERANDSAPEHEVLQLRAKIDRARTNGAPLGEIKLAPYPEFLSIAGELASEPELVSFRFDPSLPRPMSDERYRDRLISMQENCLPTDLPIPDDLDDRQDFIHAKQRLERKIASVTSDPNTISSITEAYCNFNSIRPGTRSKYRRNIEKLIEITGDVPINHVRTEDLKQLRDQMIGSIKPASIHAIFTPIKSILSFAFDENLIDPNPMFGVRLPPDKRPIEERKWKSFEPDEVSRILEAAARVWGNPARGLSDERRDAIQMVVRVLAFSGMRPIEVIRLQKDKVDEERIVIVGSKTESSTRVIPLHPEISDFPAWVAAGGLKTFETIKTDRVGSVRHNFGRLLREQMSEPILDPQKTLYSLRSTFVNAMRRAGADIQVQRAILGHKEAGAIRHYADGPEFQEKRKWVRATDPRR